MAEILKYAAGVERQGSTGMTDRERQANALMDLARKFRDQMQTNALAGIAQAQNEARADIIQDTIDPERRKTDEAYAAIMLRNDLNTAREQMLQAVSDPNSPQSNMEPEEFAKAVSKEGEAFYKGLENSKFKETQARIFTAYNRTNMPEVIAKQAVMYKKNMKTKQGQAAITALSALPQAPDQDSFDLNTTALLSDALPSTRFSSTERLDAVMAAAVGAAHNGDGRLLDYARKYMDAGLFTPAKVQQGENALSQHKKLSEEAMWAQAATTREQMSMSGEYSLPMMFKDLEDPETRRQFGESTIRRWGTKAHENYISGQNSLLAGDRLRSGTPMNVPDKVAQATLTDFRKELEARAGNDPMKQAEAISEYGFYLSKQAVIDKGLKEAAQGYMNRPVYTKEAFEDPGFQKTAVTYRELSKTMSPEQLVSQFGKEAMTNAELVNQFLRNYGGDVEKAGDAYLKFQISKKNQPELDASLPKPDPRDLQGAVSEIISGDIDGHDPAMDTWLGLGSAASDAIHTRQLEYQLTRQYGIERQAGLADAAAWKNAKLKVAAGAQFFGNEVVWTDGTSMNATLNMPEGSSAKDRQKAFETFCIDKGIRPGAAHFALYGKYGQITDANGEPIEELGLFPTWMIGQMYEQEQRDADEIKDAEDDDTYAKGIADRNRMMENSLNFRTGYNDEAQILEDGTTLGDFKMSDESGRLAIRKAYDEQTRTWFGKIMQKGGEFITAVREGKYKGEAAERFRTIANQDMLDYLDSPPEKDAAVPDEMFAGHSTQKPEQEGQLYSSRDNYQNASANEAEQDDVAAFKEEQASAVESQIKKHEGFRGAPYKDSVGVKTVGFGRNLRDNPITAAEWKAIGGKRDLTKEPLTEEEAGVLFKNDMKRANSAVKNIFGKTLDKLSTTRKNVLVDMAFNLGQTKLTNFKDMVSAIKAGKYDMAAEEMKDSKWYKQVGSRAATLVRQMKEG